MFGGRTVVMNTPYSSGMVKPMSIVALPNIDRTQSLCGSKPSRRLSHQHRAVDKNRSETRQYSERRPWDPPGHSVEGDRSDNATIAIVEAITRRDADAHRVQTSE